MFVNVQARFILATSKEVTAAVRLDRILSFAYNEREGVLSIRYIDEQQPDRFEGEIAEAIIRDLRLSVQP
jgi:hypothetical protein